MSYPISLPLKAESPLATLRHPTPELWELEMHNAEDNRLTADFLSHVLYVALDLVEKDWRSKDGAPGALVISGKQNQQKFFSNGLDFANSSKDLGFFPNVFNPTITRLLTFPIPTVAAINGHAFAAGYILALSCDYRVMTSGRGWCSMNEIQFGAPLPLSLASILEYKLPSPQIVRKTALEAHRFTAQELHALEIVDVLAEGGTPGVLKAARELATAKAPLAKTGVWGLMKKDLQRHLLEDIAKDYRQIMAPQEAALARSKL